MRTVKATYQAPDDNQSVTCKFEANLDVASDYQRLVSKLTKIFPELAASNFTIHCPDSGGDTIVAATDDDIFIALGSIPQGGTLNIVIEEKAHPSRVAPRSGIGCDTCGVSIYGHRYKCTVCTNFYLCANCEQLGRHSHHPVMRTTTDEPPRPSSQRTRLWDMGCHRQSPLFEDFGSRQRATRPFGSGFFHCLNPSAFEEFHQMAADLTRAWCGSMPPPTSTTHSSNAHSSQARSETRHSQPTHHTRSRDAQQQDPGYHVYTKSEEFDQGLFTQMVDEMTEKMNSTMDSIGDKHKASNRPTAKNNGGQYHHSDENSPSDFVQMTEMLSPMMKNLIGAVGGECNTQEDDHEPTGHQDGQNKEYVTTNKEVEQTSSNGNPDAEFVSHVASKTQSSPCDNNNGPDAKLISHVASKKQCSPCINKKEHTTAKVDNREQSTAGRTDNLKPTPYFKDNVLPDPPQYATIQKGSSLYPKMDQTNSNTKNKEDSVKSPTTTGIPRFNTHNKQGTSSHTAHNGPTNPSVFNKTRSSLQTTDSGLASSKYTTGIRLPNQKTEVQSSSHTETGEAGSYTTNEEQSTPCGTNKEQSTPCGTNREQSTPCGTNKEQHTPCGTNKEQSTPCGTNKEQSTPCGTNKEQSTPCETNKEQSTPCGTIKEQSNLCGTNKEQSTPCGTNKEQSILCGINKEQSTTCGTYKEQSTPCGTNKEQSTPCSTNKGQSSHCNSTGKHFTPHAGTKEGSSLCSESKELSSIQPCKSRQTSASNDKAKLKDPFIPNNVQPKLSVFKAKDHLGTLDVSACNGAHGIINKQCGTSLTKDEPVSDHLSDGTLSNTKCTSNSIQLSSQNTNLGQVVTKLHTNSVEKNQCQEPPVHTAHSKQSHRGANNPRQSSIPQPSARKTLPSTSNTGNFGYSSAHSSHTRRPYFDPRGASAANKAISRERKPPHGDSKRGKTCQCGNPFDTKSIHRLTSPCSEPTPGTSSMPDTASATGAKDDQETEDEKLTNALDSLETMGFADVGGSLTELLKEEDYDVWRVLERVLTY